MSAEKTHWKKLHNPDYIGAYALQPGEEKTLTIKSVGLEMVSGADGKKDQCTVAHFIEAEKPMILNVTNAKQIAKLHGTPYIEDWSGKKITIYAARVKAFGEEVEALRIRPVLPVDNKPELTPDHPKWGDAAAAFRLKTATPESIRKYYTLSESNLKKLQDEAGKDQA